MMTVEEQLSEWVKGNSIHNDDRDGLAECVPDFSCCDPKLQAPLEIREEFAAADDDKRMKMLLQFLGKAFESEFGKSSDKIYIAGQSENLA